MDADTEGAARSRKFTQARGRARRQALLQAARVLLFERDLEQITLPAVAEQAGIPASSTYHFYADMKDLYKDLAREIAAEMTDVPLAPLAPRRWEDLIRPYTKIAVDFYNRDTAARQLMLGPKTPPDIKRAGCAREAGFGDSLMAFIGQYFTLPDLPNPSAIFFRAIQVADALFMISVEDHGHITEEYQEDASDAMIAYLGLYLPRLLPRRLDDDRKGSDARAARGADTTKRLGRAAPGLNTRKDKGAKK